MNVDAEVQEIRALDTQTLRLIPYIAEYAPQRESVIRQVQSYDKPLESSLTLKLATSGVRMPKHSVMASSFLL